MHASNKRSSIASAASLAIVYLILTYIIIGPNYALFSNLSFHDTQRIYLLVFELLATTYWLASFSLKNNKINAYNKLFVHKLTGILLLSILISIFLSSNTNYALLDTLNILALFPIALIFTNYAILTPGISIKIIVFFGVGLGLYSYLFIVTYTSAMLTSLSLDTKIMFHGFSNYRFFNQVQTWMLPILILPLLCKLSNKKYPGRYLPILLGLVCFNIVLLIFSSSRGASLALLLSLFIILLLVKPIAIRLLTYVALLSLTAFTLYWLMFIISPPYFGFEINDSMRIRTVTSDRLHLWLICVDMIKQSPFFGAGPMSFAAIPNALSISHPHNSVLQLAAEWGLIASSIVLFFYTKGIYAFWQACLDQSVTIERRMYRASLLWSLFAASIYSLFSGVIVMPMSQLLGAIVIGLMLAEYRSFRPILANHFITPPIPFKPIISIASLLLVSLYVSLIWTQLEPRIYSDISYANKIANSGPRFWQIGGAPPANH